MPKHSSVCSTCDVHKSTVKQISRILHINCPYFLNSLHSYGIGKQSVFVMAAQPAFPLEYNTERIKEIYGKVVKKRSSIHQRKQILK